VEADLTIEYDDKGKLYTNIIQKTKVAATIQTVLQRIQGHIHVSNEQSLKDELEQNESFLAVTASTIINPEGEAPQQNKFIVIQRSHITWVVQDLNRSEDHEEESK
jgi:hypothetical protein